MSGLSFAFASPAILAALILLPAIWWLLRLTPPQPRAEVFPPLRILATILKREETPARSPWWLTLLRMLLAALVILAIANPMFNPRTNTLSGSGPLVLMIDSKFFGGDCLVAGIGIDLLGKKHVLGLWHGATENSTVVKGLLEDLVSRGLDPEHKMLIVIDGAKALRKAVTMVLGDRALVQRCRIHKLRNVLDQLPKEKQTQARWRMQSAWSQKDPNTAERELRKTARWLEESCAGLDTRSKRLGGFAA